MSTEKLIRRRINEIRMSRQDLMRRRDELKAQFDRAGERIDALEAEAATLKADLDKLGLTDA